MLIGESWRELWRRNRGGGFLTLAFWYTLLTSFYQYLVASRLGPSFPKGFTNLVSHPYVINTLHLSGSLWLRLILVYLTFLLIIVPFGMGALYGGIASAFRTRPQFTSFFAFFRFGWINFWRALGQLVLAIIYGALLTVVVLLMFALLSGLGTMGAVIGLVIAIAALIWMVGTLLWWFGFTFYTEQSPVVGFWPAMRWGATHRGRLFSSTILLLGLLLATIMVAALLETAIPVIGAMVMVLVVGMVVPAFLVVYALLLYGQSAGSDV